MSTPSNPDHRPLGDQTHSLDADLDESLTSRTEPVRVEGVETADDIITRHERRAAEPVVVTERVTPATGRPVPGETVVTEPVVTERHTNGPVVVDDVPDDKGPVQEDVVRSPWARWALTLLRLVLGFNFLWAFLDKTFGLKYATGWTNPATGKTSKSWLDGGSPTEGFLKFGTNPDGPFHDMFSSMAGKGWADWLFMLGLLGIGVALILGAGVKLAGWLGALLVFLMWLAVWPVGKQGLNNPFLDEHITELAALVTLATTYAGDTLGIGKWWRKIVGDSFLR